ncbi:unnamed protein product [Closterium sp. NIES-53]
MHSRRLVCGLPQSLPLLSPTLAPPCTPRVEGRQGAAPHSLFPPTTTSLQTLHMDVWGPAPVHGPHRERYILLVVDDFTRYTTVFPLQHKGDVRSVLIPWIRAVHSSGPAEGGDTVASRCPPRLETPPGFPPQTSSSPLQPVTVDSEALVLLGVVTLGGCKGFLVGGVEGTAAGGSGGVLQPLPQRPLFWEQQPSLLPLPSAATGGCGSAASGGPTAGGIGSTSAGAGGARAGGAGAGGASAGGTRAGGAGAGGADTGVGGTDSEGFGHPGTGASSVRAGGAGSGGESQSQPRRPFF